MTQPPITVLDALDEAMEFARGAWRGAWAPMVLVAAGWALLVVGNHAELRAADAAPLKNLGFVLLLFHLPLLGALYRLGLGGGARQGLGPGGMQIGGVEGRILGVNGVLFGIFLIACAPVVAASAVVYMILRRFNGVTLGPLGHWAWWFLFAAILWIAALAGLIYLGGRLVLATPQTVERRRLSPWDGWDLTQAQGWTIAAVLAAAHTPMLLVFVGLKAFGWIEPGEPPVGLHGAWPVWDSIGAGVVAGAALAVVQAPLSIGVITVIYDMLAPWPEAADAPVAPLVEDAHEPEVEWEDDVAAAIPEPEPVAPDLAEADPVEAEEVPPTPVDDVQDEPVPAEQAHLEPEPTPPVEPVVVEAVAGAGEEQAPGDQTYPHSLVEFSPEHGRFTRLFSPWLAEEHPSEPEPEAELEPPPPVETPPLRPPALDGADEAEHAEP